MREGGSRESPKGLPSKTTKFSADFEAALEAQLSEGLGREVDLPDCLVGKKYTVEPVPTDVQLGRDTGLYVTTLGGGAGEIIALRSVYRVSQWGGPTFEVSVIPPRRNTATTLFAADPPADVAVDGRTVYATHLR